MATLLLCLVLVAIIAVPRPARAADPDWKAVEQALGKSGQFQAGDVYRIGMLRTDLTVSVKGVSIKAPLAALGESPVRR